MKNKKIIWISLVVVIVVLLIISAVVNYQGRKDIILSDIKVKWNFVKAGYDESLSMPITEVSIIVDEKNYDVGKYQGTCSEENTANEQSFAGTISRASCWWAGAGKEISVVNENGKIVVKDSSVQEDDTNSYDVRTVFKIR